MIKYFIHHGIRYSCLDTVNFNDIRTISVAKDGNSYKDAKLQDADLHKLEHKHGGY